MMFLSSGRTLDDPRRPKLYSEQQYLRSPEEMVELFKDIPAAIENTIEIAKRCTVELTLGKNYLPDFPIPEGLTIEQFLEEESRKGKRKTLQKNVLSIMLVYKLSSMLLTTWVSPVTF